MNWKKGCVSGDLPVHSGILYRKSLWRKKKDTDFFWHRYIALLLPAGRPARKRILPHGFSDQYVEFSR